MDREARDTCRTVTVTLTDRPIQRGTKKMGSLELIFLVAFKGSNRKLPEKLFEFNKSPGTWDVFSGQWETV